MPATGQPRSPRVLSALAFALALMLSGCGGSSEPQGKVKPAETLSPEMEAAIKKMQSEAKPLPKEEDVAPKKKGTTKGIMKGVTKKK